MVYLGKLEFTGNTFTKDHVIRREWFLREGRRLNINALEDSIKRMKQLGLVTIEKMPEIKPDPQDPQKINITADVKEVNRQMINFNVGYSGYEGWFLALGYSTQNFLGMGETFALNLQQGTIAKNYQFAFTEPYLFNSQASFGIDISKTYYRYPNLYTRQGEGFNVSSRDPFLEILGRIAGLQLGKRRHQRCQRRLYAEFLLFLLLHRRQKDHFRHLSHHLLFHGGFADFPAIGQQIPGQLPLYRGFPGR